MCGIYGRFNREKSLNEEQFLSCLNKITSRGPDMSGTHRFGDKYGFGFRRLAIIDLSEHGNQPMLNEDSSVAIVFNGEIYNYKDIKKKITSKHVFKSKTDTEVLIHRYEDIGQKIVNEIEGMFAFCIFDKNTNNLTLARDHFGKKPLYYYLDKDSFIFGSELKTILENKDIKNRLTLNKASLLKYLYYGYIPAPHTIFNEIHKLEPSTTFQFDLDAWKIVNKYTYWKLEEISVVNTYKEEDILDKLDYLIKDSVKKRMMSDVPLGVFLSGGVDSSLITAYLSQMSEKVNSFSVVYKNSNSADESKYAKKVAAKLNINNYLCNFEDSLVKDNFIEILDYLDEPMADAAIVPLYYVSKFAKDKITVVLSGDGGDELFGGYEKYRAQKFIEDFGFMGFITPFLRKFVNENSIYYKMLSGFSMTLPQRNFVFGSGSFLPGEISKLISFDNAGLSGIFNDAEDYYSKITNWNPINSSMYLDAKIQLPDWYLVKGDRATMANSLEMRNPLLDKNLAEFAFSLGDEWKIKGGETKYLLKKLASGYVGNEVVYRKKAGFGVPLDKWIREDLKELFAEYLLKENEFFDVNYVTDLFEKHLQGEDHRFKLLRIFNFNYWYERYFR